MKQATISRVRIWLWSSLLAAPAALGLAALGLASGCGSLSSSLCDQICDCVGCNDSARNECVTDAENAAQKADDVGCGDKYSEWLSCVNGELLCTDGDIDADGCETEAKVAGNCLGSPVGLSFGDDCAAAADHVAECLPQSGSGSSGGTQVECTGAVRCQAKCVSASSCDTLTGKDTKGLSDFTKCLADCQSVQ